MSKKLTKEDVIIHKKQSIKVLNNLLEKYIHQDLKKASILSYWINDYANYIDKEESFEPKKLISYKRGNLIKAHFGFNVGCEYGGLHYAVVLDNDNKHSSSVVTVVPLTSGEEKKLYERDVYIGDEIFRTLNLKQKMLQTSINERKNEKEELGIFLKELDNKEVLKMDKDLRENLIKTIRSLNFSLKEIIKEEKKLNNMNVEIQRMKVGSIVKMEQITTISKMRIYTPKSTNDILYNIKLSSESMEKINDKLKELFVF